MRKSFYLITWIISLFASSSFAELSLGVYGGLNQVQPHYSGTGSASGKQGTEFGALLLIPSLPTLNWRLGLAQTTHKAHYNFDITDSQGSTIRDVPMDVSETLLDLVVGAQWDLPVTGLYVLGGAKVSSSQSVTCDINKPNINANGACLKSKTDFPAFVGVGYNFLNTSLIHFNLEGEYAAGSSSSLMDSRMSAWTGRVMVQLGL